MTEAWEEWERQRHEEMSAELDSLLQKVEDIKRSVRRERTFLRWQMAGFLLLLGLWAWWKMQ